MRGQDRVGSYITSLEGCHVHCPQVASMILNVEGFQSDCRKPCSHLRLEQALLPSLLVSRSGRESMAFQRLSFPKLLLWKNKDLMHLRLVIKYSICGTEPHGLARIGSMHHGGRYVAPLLDRALPLHYVVVQSLSCPTL